MVKKILSICCAICIVTSVAAPAFAIEHSFAPFNQIRAVEDDYIKRNEPFSGDYISFSVPDDKPYMRVSIKDTSPHGIIRLRLYEVVNSEESEIDSFMVESGKWGETAVIYAVEGEYHIRMDMYDGYTPEGLITVRVSAQDFSN